MGTNLSTILRPDDLILHFGICGVDVKLIQWTATVAGGLLSIHFYGNVKNQRSSDRISELCMRRARSLDDRVIKLSTFAC